MSKPKSQTNRSPGRYDEPIPPIPDTPENIVRAVSRRSPKKDWRFLKGKGSQPQQRG